MKEVIFEEGCKYIGKSVFKNCTKLKKVRLPKSLLEIGDVYYLVMLGDKSNKFWEYKWRSQKEVFVKCLK